MLDIFISYDSYAGMYTILRIQNLEDAKKLLEGLTPSHKDLMKKSLEHFTQNYQNGSIYSGLPTPSTVTNGKWSDFYHTMTQKYESDPQAISSNNTNNTTNHTAHNVNNSSANETLKKAMEFHQNKQYQAAFPLFQQLE